MLHFYLSAERKLECLGVKLLYEMFVLHSLTMSLTASATKLVTPSVSKSDVYIFLLLIFIDFSNCQYIFLFRNSFNIILCIYMIHLWSLTMILSEIFDCKNSIIWYIISNPYSRWLKSYIILCLLLPDEKPLASNRLKHFQISTIYMFKALLADS